MSMLDRLRRALAPKRTIPRQCWYCDRIFYLRMSRYDEVSFGAANYCRWCEPASSPTQGEEGR